MPAEILIVEDESGIRQLIKDALDDLDYEIVMCNNAMNAKTQIKKRIPDLAIIDWMMPQISGVELVKSLRRDQSTSHLPVIMLTARSSEDDTIEGLDAGADDYITKPFSPKELRSRVQAALRRTARFAQVEHLQHGVITIDTNAMRVSVGDTEVTLGQTEFKLLQFFLNHPDRVFSREQLLDNVWGVNAFVEERTVDVHILRLRKALKSHGVEKIIDTVRGAGYRLSTAV